MSPSLAATELDPVDPEPLIFDSFMWGLISALSLNIGSVIGVTCLPGQKVRAVLMSFGGGALLFALSIELFGNTLGHNEGGDNAVTVMAMEGAAVLGGCLFAFLNHALNVLGADVRKPSTTKDRMLRLRQLLLRRLVYRLHKIPFFSALSVGELRDLVDNAMYKERFSTGDIIMSSETRDNGIFFVISGLVRLEIYREDQSDPPGSARTKESLKDACGKMVLSKPVDATAISGTDSECFTPSSRAPSVVSRPQSNPSTSEVLRSWDLGPNQLFGDMTLLAGSYLRCVAIALENTKVLALPGHEVARLIDSNAAVRGRISLRAMESLRQVPELKRIPDAALASLSAQCSLVQFQPGQTVFRGKVDETTPLVCLVLGSIKIKYHKNGGQHVLRAGRLLCTEHLKGLPSQSFTACALEAICVVLIIERDDLNAAMAAQRQAEGRPEGLLQVVAAHPPPQNMVQPDAFANGRSCSPDSLKTDCLDEPDDTLAFLNSEESPDDVAGVRTFRFDTAKDIPSLPGQVVEAPCSVPNLSIWRRPWEEHLSLLGHSLGWNDDEQDVDESFMTFVTASMPADMTQVTDSDLTEQEVELYQLRQEEVRASSKSTTMSSGAASSAKTSDVPPQDLTHGSTPADKLAPGAAGHHGDSNRGRHRALMVWLGILIDAVPESLVIGILINKTATPEGSSFSEAASAVLPFVAGVFLSNLPESMSSSGSMKAHGMRVSTILLLWFATTVLTAAGAALGAVLFPPGSSSDHSTEILVSSVEGLAAGAMLTMIAQTMMPEAFEQGGDIVGLSCLGGFLCALSLKVLSI